MHTLMRSWLLVVVATLAGVFLVGAGEGAAAPKRGGTLNYVLKPEPPHLQGAVSTADPVWQATSKFHNGLLNYDLELNPTPELAESWQVSPDSRTFTFKLRRGVKFHDGQDFTAADVKFTMEEVIAKHHPRGRTVFSKLQEVQTPDPYTAIFKFSAPTPFAIFVLNASETPMLPKHVYAGSDPRTNPANSAPVGTGPFRFVKWEKGQFILAERNDKYWDKGKPYVDKVIFRIIPDAAARAVAFESGDIDLGGPWPVALVDQARLGKLPHLMVESRGYTMVSPMFYFEFNMRDPAFQDVRVRRAFAHAINRAQLAEVVWHGFGTPATGPISDKLTRFYSASVPKYEYAPKKAEALLDEAGVKRGSDGVRMRLTFDPAPYDEHYLRSGEFIRQQLRQIGVEATLRNQDTPTYLRRIWTGNEFQLNLYGISNTPDPTIGVQRLYWSKNIVKGAPFTNGSGYVNPQMDRLLEAAQVEPDQQKRRKLWEEFQQLAMTELPIIPLLRVDNTTVLNRRVKNFLTSGLGVYDTLADVYIEQ
jgi:peptide/nickel transport system substrate-binding protein